MPDPFGSMPPQTSEIEPGTQPEKPEGAPIQDGAKPEEVAPATPQEMSPPPVSQPQGGEETGSGLDRAAATDMAAKPSKPVVDGLGAPPEPSAEAQPLSNSTGTEPHELEAQVGETSNTQVKPEEGPVSPKPVAEKLPQSPASNSQPNETDFPATPDSGSPALSPEIPSVVKPEGGADDTSYQPEKTEETEKPDPNKTIAEIEKSLDRLKGEINENPVKNIETTTGGESV